ncbi:unnamed protein product, partial [Didymodactylos carnosus]
APYPYQNYSEMFDGRLGLGVNLLPPPPPSFQNMGPYAQVRMDLIRAEQWRQQQQEQYYPPPFNANEQFY